MVGELLTQLQSLQVSEEMLADVRVQDCIFGRAAALGLLVRQSSDERVVDAACVWATNNFAVSEVRQDLLTSMYGLIHRVVEMTENLRDEIDLTPDGGAFVEEYVPDIQARVCAIVRGHEAVRSVLALFARTGELGALLWAHANSLQHITAFGSVWQYLPSALELVPEYAALIQHEGARHPFARFLKADE